ncbi:hypothetical protein GGX14DRAFT_390701 [Mycena pura]|uniref:Tet-like 2OG-Fe(II) oxygenase domain-containing protein n=1 Tax=Mycena pura TaxID=153505 RepID=A0AAD6YHP6_9AGAR|nr:hypothetical protein GGX14DRAFT_390701 [Mycena pura]
MTSMTSEDLEEGITIELRALNLCQVPGDYSKRGIEEMSDLSECEDTVDREDGEISDHGELTDTKKAKTDNQKCAAHRKLQHAHIRSQQQQDMEKAQLEMKLALALVYQYGVTEIHIHNLWQKPKALEKLQKRELKKGFPLTHADVDELLPDTVWIHEPGIYLGLLSEARQNLPTIALLVKIQSWDNMEPRTRIEVQSTLQHVMDWGEHVYEIKNNAAAKSTSKATAHGTSIIPLKEPQGVMYGMGWHQSQEEGKSMVNYAPKNKGPEALAIYEKLNSKLPEVTHYIAMDFHVCSLVVQHNFKMSLTSRDSVIFSTMTTMRAPGLVEIFWHGKIDYHGTLFSMDDPGFTRFGTSIQITKKGVDVMRKVWNVGELAQSGHNIHMLEAASRVATTQDWIDKANEVSTIISVIAVHSMLLTKANKKRKKSQV